MCQHVSHEITFLCAFEFTLVAAERLFSGMNKNVLFQMRSSGERGSTHGAFVAFLSSLLCFGLGSKRHRSEFSGILAIVFGDWWLQCWPSSPSDLSFLYQSSELTEEKQEFQVKILWKSESDLRMISDSSKVFTICKVMIPSCRGDSWPSGPFLPVCSGSF